MATRRTTMKSRTGTELYAVRDEGGKFKDLQTCERAHAADVRRTSKAEKVAAQGTIEKKVRKAADNALKSVKSSVRGAVAAAQRAANRFVNLSGSAAGGRHQQSYRDTRQPSFGYVGQRSPRSQARGWPAVTSSVARRSD